MQSTPEVPTPAASSRPAGNPWGTTPPTSGRSPGNPWGTSPGGAAWGQTGSPKPMSLQDVMDEEQSEVLAKKLQQEETGQLPQHNEDGSVHISQFTLGYRF